ncbi:MAG: IMPACT family protein [Lepagella sp.]
MDTYRTLSASSSARYTVKMSRFLAFAYPVASEEEAKALIRKVANDYHDARHVCWAYMLGHDRSRYQSSDNGEPSGTAGKPILGQVNSLELTDVLVLVVRYFGGIKLGTGGLIDAYRTAARMALDEAPVEERHAQATFQVACPYVSLNTVMGAIKALGLRILAQDFDNTCVLTLSVRLDHVAEATRRLSAAATVTRLS